MSLAAVDLVWVDTDRHAALTRLAMAGLVLAAVFAVVGLPPLDVHSPAHYLGVMAPSCGLTRGSVALARGSLTDALRFNPASPLVLAGGIALVARAVAGVTTGRWLDVRFHLQPLGWLLVVVAVTALAINQQIHAELLR